MVFHEKVYQHLALCTPMPQIAWFHGQCCPKKGIHSRIGKAQVARVLQREMG